MRILTAGLGLGLFASAALGLAQTQVPFPPTEEGTYLTGNLRNAVFDQLKAALDAQNAPSAWIDELKNSPPDIRFSNIGDNQGMYQPAYQGPFGNGLAGDTIHLQPGISPLHLTDDQISTITHEAWHAWFDLIPTYPFSGPISRFSDAQDEAIGGLLGELVVGHGLSKAVGSAINEAMGEDRGGTARTTVDAILVVESAWGSLFAQGFVNDKDVRDWATLRRTYPEIQDLESHFSDADRQKLQARLDELERLRQAEGDLDETQEEEVELQRQSSAVPSAPAETLWGLPVSQGSEAMFASGGTSYPVDGSLALSPVAGGVPADAISPWVNVGPGALNSSAVSSASPASGFQLMIVLYLQGTAPAARPADLGRPVGGRVASLGGSSLERPSQTPAATSSPPLQATIEALGVSTGEAFTFTIANAETEAVRFAAAGVVLEPVSAKQRESVLKDFGKRTQGLASTQVRADGYCLEFLREPPAPGTLYRVAGEDVQKKFQPMRSILRAARSLMDDGALTPDSDPEQYFHSMVQWALWSKERGFDANSFVDAFVERTKKNFDAAKQPWTKDIEQAVRGLAPARFRGVELILSEALKLDSLLPG
jgi:hypothetical protein